MVVCLGVGGMVDLSAALSLDEDEEAGNAGAGLDARILRDLMTSAVFLSRSRILLAMLGMTSNG